MTIVSIKGGVAKTTLSANLGALLADLEKRVLLIDADIQPTLASYYPSAHSVPTGLVEVLETGGTSAAISTTEIGCDIIVSNDPEGRFADWILHCPDGLFRLKCLLKDASMAMTLSSWIHRAPPDRWRRWRCSPLIS